MLLIMHSANVKLLRIILHLYHKFYLIKWYNVVYLFISTGIIVIVHLDLDLLKSMFLGARKIPQFEGTINKT